MPKTQHKGLEAGIKIGAIHQTPVSAEAVSQIRFAIQEIIRHGRSDAVTLLALQVMNDATKGTACIIHDCNFVMDKEAP